MGKTWTIDETFQREHQISAHFMRHPDFIDGVKALLLSKPARQATWQPATFDKVTNEYVDSFFALPEDESWMELVGDASFKDYPHSKYALPSEMEIELVFREKLPMQAPTAKVLASIWGEKEVVEQKVADVLARRTVQNDQGGLQWQ